MAAFDGINCRNIMKTNRRSKKARKIEKSERDTPTMQNLPQKALSQVTVTEGNRFKSEILSRAK
jgi:hypothetical protein